MSIFQKIKVKNWVLSFLAQDKYFKIGGTSFGLDDKFQVILFTDLCLIWKIVKTVVPNFRKYYKIKVGKLTLL